jgi:dienelactone hydrolase
MLLVAVLLALGAGNDTLHRTELLLKTPRPRDPVLGGERGKLVVSVWIPGGVKTVRGAVCNPFAREGHVGAHWEAACRHWGFAHVQADFDAVKKDELGLLEQGLKDLAKTSGHPELATMPLFFLGMSRGGGMSMQLAELMPARTLAAVPVCLEVGPSTLAGRAIPVVTIFGEKDGKQMELLSARLPKERALGARFAIAVQWNRRHEFGQANNLAFVVLDEVISRRLPRDPGPLHEIPLKDGWLGDVSGWGKDGQRPAVAAWADYKGERDQACWLPSRRSAFVWRAFVSGTRDVTFSSPPGLGDKQPFAVLPAGKTADVKLSLSDKLKPAKVELWDGDELLASKNKGPWTFAVKLKPGIHSLYAVVSQDGAAERSSRPHTVVVGAE